MSRTQPGFFMTFRQTLKLRSIRFGGQIAYRQHYLAGTFVMSRPQNLQIFAFARMRSAQKGHSLSSRSGEGVAGLTITVLLLASYFSVAPCTCFLNSNGLEIIAKVSFVDPVPVT